MMKLEPVILKKFVKVIQICITCIAISVLSPREVQ